MRSFTSLTLIASAMFGSFTLVAGCGDDDRPDPSTGGTSQGGSSGSGGSKGGSAGNTGGATGGGSSGASGVGGTAGVGEAGQATGGAPGGSGGDAGAGNGGGGAGADCIGAVDLELFDRLAPLGAVPADSTNQYADNAAARTFGQRLFFDKLFSGPLGIVSDLGAVGETGKVACSSCHLGEFMEDHRSTPPAVSIAAGTHPRNAPALVNSSFYVWTNWAGRFSAQWELPLPVAENAVIMNGNRLAIAHRMAARYKADYEAIFGALDAELGTTSTRFPPAGKPKPAPTTAVPNPPDGPWELMAPADRDIVNRVFVNFGKALHAYNRQLVSRNAPFDRWVAGDCDAIDDAAERGALLFVGKARCNTCHSNQHFTDDQFHNLGVAQGVPPNPDQGRFADAVALLNSPISAASTTWSDDPAEGTRRRAGLTNPMPESTRGAFRTPSLRGVADTAPYMHSGQIATLEAVVGFYNSGGGAPVVGIRDPLIVPLGLTTAESADLVAFLRTLSGQGVPASLLVDTSAGP